MFAENILSLNFKNKLFLKDFLTFKKLADLSDDEFWQHQKEIDAFMKHFEHEYLPYDLSYEQNVKNYRSRHYFFIYHERNVYSLKNTHAMKRLLCHIDDLIEKNDIESLSVYKELFDIYFYDTYSFATGNKSDLLICILESLNHHKIRNRSKIIKWMFVDGANLLNLLNIANEENELNLEYVDFNYQDYLDFFSFCNMNANLNCLHILNNMFISLYEDEENFSSDKKSYKEVCEKFMHLSPFSLYFIHLNDKEMAETIYHEYQDYFIDEILSNNNHSAKIIKHLSSENDFYDFVDFLFHHTNNYENRFYLIKFFSSTKKNYWNKLYLPTEFNENEKHLQIEVENLFLNLFDDLNASLLRYLSNSANSHKVDDSNRFNIETRLNANIIYFNSGDLGNTKKNVNKQFESLTKHLEDKKILYYYFAVKAFMKQNNHVIHKIFFETTAKMIKEQMARKNLHKMFLRTSSIILKRYFTWCVKYGYHEYPKILFLLFLTINQKNIMKKSFFELCNTITFSQFKKAQNIMKKHNGIYVEPPF